jgi:hypothetical protein
MTFLLFGLKRSLPCINIWWRYQETHHILTLRLYYDMIQKLYSTGKYPIRNIPVTIINKILPSIKMAILARQYLANFIYKYHNLKDGIIRLSFVRVFHIKLGHFTNNLTSLQFILMTCLFPFIQGFYYYLTL